MTGYVLDFQEIDRTQVATVGGKAANLGELSRIDQMALSAAAHDSVPYMQARLAAYDTMASAQAEKSGVTIIKNVNRKSFADVLDITRTDGRNEDVHLPECRVPETVSAVGKRAAAGAGEDQREALDAGVRRMGGNLG